MFNIVTGRGSTIHIPFGSSKFKFSYTHGKRHGGGRGIFVARQYIEDLMEYGDQFISRGDVAFDGGANQGIYTTAFANYVGATGKVISIEPMKYAVDLIQKNCELNGLDNVEIANAGLSDEIGTARLDLSEGVGSASITNDYGGEDVIEIETTTIDTLVEQFSLDRVDFIKLDIEGAELKALYGAKNTIEKFNPRFCLEVTSDTGVEAHEHLINLGYAGYVFVEGQLEQVGQLNLPYPNIFYMRG